VAEPRLRFDRVAVGLVARLQASLSRTVPDGKTVVVTVTAPIRQDSKTGTLLEAKLRELLAAQRAWLKSTIRGNRIEVRVLKGGTGRPLSSSLRASTVFERILVAHPASGYRRRVATLSD
jgi:hypothetical protein